jgi:predicted nucleotidyltransferase
LGCGRGEDAEAPIYKAPSEKINMDISKNLENLKAFLGRQDFVRVAYIFGSFAEGRQGPLSDMDFAVLLDKSLNRKEMARKKMILLNGISSIMHTDNFDIVIMNEASTLMNFNIINQGKVLKAGRERVPLEMHVMSDYLDRKYYEDLNASITLERISREGIL